jgi:hypothetical protein
MRQKEERTYSVDETVACLATSHNLVANCCTSPSTSSSPSTLFDVLNVNFLRLVELPPSRSVLFLKWIESGASVDIAQNNRVFARESRDLVAVLLRDGGQLVWKVFSEFRWVGVYLKRRGYLLLR